ncbi:unnamed protein product [Rhizopus stolonifer]
MIFSLGENELEVLYYLDFDIKKEKIEVGEFNEFSRNHLLKIWSAFTTSTTILEIKESGLFARNNPMLIIIDILSHMSCLIKLDYTSIAHHIGSIDNTDNTDNKICMLIPKETDIISLNHSLESLFLTANQIDEDIYRSNFDSNVYMARGRNVQNSYTIHIPSTHFKSLDSSAKFSENTAA